MASDKTGADNNDRLDELASQFNSLSKEEREALRARLDESTDLPPPQAGWNTDPLRLKAALRRLRDGESIQRDELGEYLGTIENITAPQSVNYGLAARDSNDLFAVERGDEKASDRISLTEQGEEIAELFNDDMDGLTPIETTVYRGLALCGEMAVFLGILERHRCASDHDEGMLKSDVMEEMGEVYATSVDNRVGYNRSLCSDLGLITSSRDGNKARYKIAVPDRP